jgi:membrane-associated phospholipid phosphatase
MYRGMHYPTDTATSFLLGIALLAIAFHALPLSGGRPGSGEHRDRRRNHAGARSSTADLAHS